MSLSERETLTQVLEEWALRQVRTELAHVGRMAGHGAAEGEDEEAVVIQDNVPLFFGTWSGVRMFHVVKPFYASIVKEQ